MSALPVTNYAQVIEQIQELDPVLYGKSRNYGNGAVTRLSPYISRGVISTRMVYQAMLAKGYKLYQMEQFVKELCWRDYFQRVLQHRQTHVTGQDARPQERVQYHGIPQAVTTAQTGITAIDKGIETLYQTGYLHNHLRMYIASLVTNIAQYHWQQPAAWMYYHLLDADVASNNCSWQWVCGVNSSKKYYANQENINKYFNTSQKGTMLDVPYEAFGHMLVPETLTATDHNLVLATTLPDARNIHIDSSLPTLVYNLYNLDTQWHKYLAANRILLLEPSHFDKFPISNQTLEWVLQLANNIPGIQVFTGAFDALQQQCGESPLHFKEHPLFRHYKGIEEPRDWIAPQVTGYYPSFFGYWKQVERQLKQPQAPTLF
jgi:deoxyribodipyrimidine photo-lyase